MSSVLPLVLAATLKVALPAFDLEQLPSVFSSRLPTAYATAIESQQCASVLPGNQLSPQASAEFAKCERQPACVSLVGRVVGAQVVVLGQARKVDAAYLIRLGVFDVKEQKLVAELEHRHEGKLTEFEKSIQQQIGTLCKAVNPAWVEPTPALPPAATPPTLSSGFDELPILPTDDPPAPAAPPPIVVKVTPIPPPVAATPPPPPAKVTPPSAPSSPLVGAVAAPDTKTQETKVPLTTVPPKPRKMPWTEIAAGGTVAAFAAGIGLGSYSRSVWGADRPATVNGVTVHSISHVEADRATGYAHAANAMFITAGALAVTTGVLFVTQGGFGFSGKF